MKAKAPIPVITIDGPAGSGKGTIARQLAAKLHYHYLDSGAMYRVLALWSQQQGIDIENIPALLEICERMDVRFGFDTTTGQEATNSGVSQKQEENVAVYLNGGEVSGDLRTETCAARASKLAAYPEVREALLSKQRSFKQAPGLIAEGRDMGTVVFPNAKHKIFLTANPEERALRRQKQLKKQGISASLGTLLADIEARDSRDQERAISPLQPAADAVLVDSTELSIEQVVHRIAELVQGGED